MFRSRSSERIDWGLGVKICTSDPHQLCCIAAVPGRFSPRLGWLVFQWLLCTCEESCKAIPSLEIAMLIFEELWMMSNRLIRWVEVVSMKHMRRSWHCHEDWPLLPTVTVEAKYVGHLVGITVCYCAHGWWKGVRCDWSRGAEHWDPDFLHSFTSLEHLALRCSPSDQSKGQPWRRTLMSKCTDE